VTATETWALPGPGITGTIQTFTETLTSGDPGSADQTIPQVAYNRVDDEYLVVWEDDRDARSSKVYGQLVAGDGALIGGEFLVASDAIRPVVAYSPDDAAYLVVWEASQLTKAVVNKQSWYGKQLWAQAVSPAGSLSGAAFKVYTYSPYSGSAERPSITYSEANNSFLVTWESPPGRISYGGGMYYLITQRASISGVAGFKTTVTTRSSNMGATAVSNCQKRPILLDQICCGETAVLANSAI